MNSGSGSEPSSRRSTSSSRPRFQVVIRMNRPIPATTGKAPPETTLGRLAEKNSASTSSIMQKNGMASHSGHFHSRQITTPISRVVTSMVPVTATP
ncbi:MAG: hypothetical protein GAK45_01532 [Pseudomonas citronellolis]|nr:MAG: hypothetical protein GAK45_01532 [Pseudomonas citronellolis]